MQSKIDGFDKMMVAVTTRMQRKGECRYYIVAVKPLTLNMAGCCKVGVSLFYVLLGVGFSRLLNRTVVSLRDCHWRTDAK
jgi:hypothetical protein